MRGDSSMKITNDDCILAAYWGSIGSVSDVLAGGVVGRFMGDIGVLGPTLGFVAGTLLGVIPVFVGAVIRTRPKTRPPAVPT